MDAAWRHDELHTIIAADDLRVAPFREDGVKHGNPTWIWCAAVEGELYVRAYHGPASRWYQAALRKRAGRIAAAGQTYEVEFQSIDGGINDLIDAAYRAKYRNSRYLKPMLDAGPRAATVKILPRVNVSERGL